MLDLFSNVLEFFSIFFFCCTLLDYKLKINKYICFLIIYLIPDILSSFFNVYISDDIDFVICVFIWIIFIKSYFNINTITSLCAYAFSYFALLILQFIFVVINAYILRIIPDYALPIVGSIYTIAVAFLFYRYINLNKPFSFLFANGKIGKFIILNFYIITVVIKFYHQTKLTTFYEHLLYIIVSLAILISSNLLLYNQLGKIKKQEEQLKSYNEYLPVLDDLIQAVRIRQHNHNNQIQAIVGLIYTHKDYDSLVTALNEQFMLATESEVPEYLLKLHMPVVAGFLYQKANEAKRNDKTILYEFTTYNLKSNAPEYLLIEMFGILIDNAIEAVPPGSTVYITVDSKDEHIRFITRNEGYILSSEDRNNFFTKGYSKKLFKKQHSGLGLYQLTRLLKKYPSSSISLWNEDTDILFELIV